MRFEKRKQSQVTKITPFLKSRTARRSKTVSNFAKRILAILDNIVMLLQREFEAKQQLRQQMRRKK